MSGLSATRARYYQKQISNICKFCNSSLFPVKACFIVTNRTYDFIVSSFKFFISGYLSYRIVLTTQIFDEQIFRYLYELSSDHTLIITKALFCRCIPWCSSTTKWEGLQIMKPKYPNNLISSSLNKSLHCEKRPTEWLPNGDFHLVSHLIVFNPSLKKRTSVSRFYINFNTS